MSHPVRRNEALWDPANISPNLKILSDNVVTNIGSSDSWQAVCAKNWFRSGKHQFEVTILVDAPTTNTWKYCVGVAPLGFDANANQKWIGSQKSWAYIGGTGGICYNAAKSSDYGAQFGQAGDIIRVSLDFDVQTIEYFKNGASQGIAARNLVGPVCPAISFTGKGSKVSLRVGDLDVDNEVATSSGPVGGEGWDPYHTCAGLVVVNARTLKKTENNHKWLCARSKDTFSVGREYFEIKILRDAPTTNTWKFCLGVCPVNFDVQHTKKWVGSRRSWAYVGGTGGVCFDAAASTDYGAPFGQDDVIGCQLDFDRQTIEFFKNGVSQGIAFQNLVGPVHCAVSLTGPESELMITVKKRIGGGGGGGPSSEAMMPLEWDKNNMSSALALETDSSIVRNTGSGDKWQSIVSKKQAVSGKAYFEFTIPLPKMATSNSWQFCLGLCPPGFQANHPSKKWVGSQGSWAYVGGTGGKCYNAATSTPYGTQFGHGSTIGCKLDLDAGTIEFFNNGFSQGIAFEKVTGPVCACVSFTATNATVQLKGRFTSDEDKVHLLKPLAAPAFSKEKMDTLVLEAEYKGMLAVALCDGKVTLKQTQFLANWRQQHNFSMGQHQQVLINMGMTQAGFDKMKNLEEMIDETQLCDVCMDAQKNAVFSKCGHMNTCFDCAVAVNQCPICRQSSTVIKVFR